MRKMKKERERERGGEKVKTIRRERRK